MPRHERAATLAAALALHLGLLALMLSLSAARPAPVATPLGPAMISLSLAPDQGKPPPPALPSKAVDRQSAFAAPTATPDPNASTTGANGCAPLEVVGRALVADPAAVDAVLRVPLEHRSIAEAVVIWNAGWSPAASDVKAPLAPARAVLEQQLAALPDECLAAPVAGPRLIPIPAGEGRTMFLVVGSGHWAWNELLRDPGVRADDPAARGLADEVRDWLTIFDSR